MNSNKTSLAQATKHKLDAAVLLVMERLTNSSQSSSLVAIQRQVAEEMGVNYQSLRTRFKRINYEAPLRSKHYKLSEEQEELVIGFIIKAVSSGCQLTLSDVAALGTVVLRHDSGGVSNDSLTTGWAQTFVSRHNLDLSSRKLQTSDNQKAAKATASQHAKATAKQHASQAPTNTTSSSSSPASEPLATSSSAPPNPILLECRLCGKWAGSTCYNVAKNMCILCEKIHGTSTPDLVSNKENQPVSDQWTQSEPIEVLQAEPAAPLQSPVPAPKCDSCDTCSQKLSVSTGKVRCNQCRAVMFCNNCTQQGALTSHSQALHPDRRAPSSRRLLKMR